jgi:hypothetical protein
MEGNINDKTAIRNDQREEVRRNRLAMRGDVPQMPPARQVQQPELLTLVLEHLDLMNRAKRLIATPADNPRKAYFTERVVEIRDYLANVDKHIAELVQQERDELTLEG